MTATASPTCPRCGHAATGNFCANCGAALAPRACPSCGATVAPGARFCHHCGTAMDGSQPPPPRAVAAQSNAPWIFAGTLIVIVLAGVAYAAQHRAAPAAPTMPNAGNAGGDASGAVTGVADDPSAPGIPAGRAPDISKLTPKEQFSRLEERINTAAEQGDSVTVIQFTPMALGAYANLPAADRDIDTRYHAAMLEVQVGMLPEAKALADTILRLAPDNLLGLYVRAMAAEYAGDSVQAKAARAEFRSHYDAEIKKNRPEYSEHRPFLEQYRTGEGAH